MSGWRAALPGAVLLGCAALAGCAAPAVPATPLQLVTDRTSYIVLDAPINAKSREFLTGDFDKAIAAGATTIRLGISSPGGVVVDAEQIIATMDRLHEQRGVRFITYNLGAVASAACYVFLAGQERYAQPRSAFLFHQAALTASGPLTGQALQEASAQMAEHERIFTQMLRTRTRLTDGDVSSFVKRTVILSPDEARRDGITTGTATFTVPPGTGAMRISVTRPPGAAAPVPTPQFNGR